MARFLKICSSARSSQKVLPDKIILEPVVAGKGYRCTKGNTCPTGEKFQATKEPNKSMVADLPTEKNVCPAASTQT